jgi:hypothetical protein
MAFGVCSLSIFTHHLISSQIQKQCVAERDKLLHQCREDLFTLLDEHNILKASSSKTISLLSNRISTLERFGFRG